MIDGAVLGRAVDHRRQRVDGRLDRGRVGRDLEGAVGGGFDRDPRCRDRTIDRHGALGADVEAGRVEHAVQRRGARVGGGGRGHRGDLDGGRIDLDARLPVGQCGLQSEPHRLDVDAGARHVGGHGVGRSRRVERDRGVDGLDEQVGCGLAEGLGRGRRVDPHGGARGVGEPRRDVPHRALAERAIDQGLRVERGAEFRPCDLGLAVCAHEHDRGLGELPLHGIRRGAGRESADRDTGDGGAGGDEDE